MDTLDARKGVGLPGSRASGLIRHDIGQSAPRGPSRNQARPHSQNASSGTSERVSNGPVWAALKKHRQSSNRDVADPKLIELSEQGIGQSGESNLCRGNLFVKRTWMCELRHIGAGRERCFHPRMIDPEHRVIHRLLTSYPHINHTGVRHEQMGSNFHC